MLHNKQAMNERIATLEKQINDLTAELFKERAAAEPEPVSPDYSFETANGPASLSDLFGDKNELVLIHNMGKSCSYCTMWADVLESNRRHIETRAALVLVSPDPADIQQKLASARGWTYRMATDASREFTSAMGFWTEENGWWPGASTFRKNADGSIVRTGKAIFGPGDAFCPPWHFFSMLGVDEESWTPN